MKQSAYKSTLTELVSAARNSDERHFMLSVLFYWVLRGQAGDFAEELRKTFYGFGQVLQSLPQTFPIDLRFKLFLLVYCHVIESRSFWVFLFNLINVAEGKPFVEYPFGKRKRSIANEVAIIKKLATQGMKRVMVIIATRTWCGDRTASEPVAASSR